MIDQFDTIAAVATPWGEGGVGVVRVSGPAALDASRAIFVFKPALTTEPEDRRLYYGYIADCEGVIDNGFLVVMRSPRSYTGEDVVELHCHGGPFILTRVVEALIAQGVRQAGPGEFTKRAYLNGKLDLARAEAVAEVIKAQTELSLSSARGRLEGGLSRKVNSIKDVLVNLLLHVEAELDFPEDEVEALDSARIIEGLALAATSVADLVATYREGKALRDGIKVLILGRPNVGKSSLLNLLLKQERAIVSPHPGTTRDLIEEAVNIRGLAVSLMDTAGLCDTTDHVEAIGVKLARERVAEAALVLFVVDSTAAGFAEDKSLLECADGKNLIVVANKTDLATDADLDVVKKAFSGHRVIFISVLRESGIDRLKESICEQSLGRAGRAAEAREGELVASLRHRGALSAALEGIARTRELVENCAAREFVATELRWSIDRLGEITGETATEEILERIFSSFCIGK